MEHVQVITRVVVLLDTLVQTVSTQYATELVVMIQILVLDMEFVCNRISATAQLATLEIIALYQFAMIAILLIPKLVLLMVHASPLILVLAPIMAGHYATLHTVLDTAIMILAFARATEIAQTLTNACVMKGILAATVS